jgi:hypothetical protein
MVRSFLANSIFFGCFEPMKKWIKAVDGARGEAGDDEVAK